MKTSLETPKLNLYSMYSTLKSILYSRIELLLRTLNCCFLHRKMKIEMIQQVLNQCRFCTGTEEILFQQTSNQCLFCMKTRVKILKHNLYITYLILKSVLHSRVEICQLLNQCFFCMKIRVKLFTTLKCAPKKRVEMIQNFSNQFYPCMKIKMEMLSTAKPFSTFRLFPKRKSVLFLNFLTQCFPCMKIRVIMLQKNLCAMYLVSNACISIFCLEKKNSLIENIILISDTIMSFNSIKNARSPSGLSEELANTSLEGTNELDATVVGDGGNNNWMAPEGSVGDTVGETVVAGAGVTGVAPNSCRTDRAGAWAAASSASTVPAKNPEGEVAVASSTPSDPSKTSTPNLKPRRGKRGSGKGPKEAAATRAVSPEKGKKREADKESWAEVAAKGFPTLLLENSSRGLEHEDYLEFSQQLMDWQFEEDATYKTCIMQSGLREGGISLVFKYPDGVTWFKRQVAKMDALKEGDTGYTVYGPGEKPYTLFTVYTSDTKAVLKKDRFVGVLWKLNPDLHKFNTVEGEIKVLGGFPLKKNPGMKVKVAISNSLVPQLAEMKPRPFELMYAGGYLRFKQITKKKAPVSTGQAQEDDDVVVMDVEDARDEALEGDYLDPDHMLNSESEDDV